MKQKTLQFLFLCWLTSGGGSIAQTNAQQTVWPGDTDNNGIVDNHDLLQIGMAYNFVGPQRTAPSTDWTPQTASDWPVNFFSGLNLAHSDCNGDGIISFVYDAFPIYVHYGQTHGTPMPNIVPQGVVGIDAQLAFEQSAASGQYQVGSTLSVPLTLGSVDLPVEDFYGIAFSIFIDTGLIDIDQVALDFIGTSWINPDFDRIYSTYRASDSKLDVAWVRTDRNNQTGFGQIGTMDFIIIDNVVTAFPPNFQIRIGDIKMIDRFGNTTAVAGDTLTVQLEPSAINSTDQEPQIKTKIQPNPATDLLWVTCDKQMERLRLFGLDGQEIAAYNPIEQRQVQWQLPQIPNGNYVLEITTRQGVVRRIVSIIK
jgi:hypothetical protein